MKVNKTSFKYLVRDVMSSALYRSGMTRFRHEGRFTIVTFHRVLTAPQFLEYPLKNIAVTCDQFEKMSSFFSEKFTCGTITETLKRYRSGECPSKPFLAITFDDGQLDNFTNALPILDRYDLKATFYVTVEGVLNGSTLWHDNVAFSTLKLSEKKRDVFQNILIEFGLNGACLSENPAANVVHLAKSLTDEKRAAFECRLSEILVGRSRPQWDGMMDKDKVCSISQKGHEIGSHSCSHSILTNCSDEKVHREVYNSREFLQKYLGIPITSFCYPNGSYNSGVVIEVEKAGYGSAVTTDWGINSESSSPLHLKRCDISSGTSISRHGNLSIPRIAMRISGLQPGLS